VNSQQFFYYLWFICQFNFYKISFL
jgi:hypothetical protein